MTAQTDNKKPIDVEFLHDIVEDDFEFEKELLNIFSENANRNMVNLENALKSEDNNTWYMAAHAFKGAAASIGAFKLAQILEYAQKHPEENLEKKTVIVAEVREEFKAVSDFISRELSEKH